MTAIVTLGTLESPAGQTGSVVIKGSEEAAALRTGVKTVGSDAGAAKLVPPPARPLAITVLALSRRYGTMLMARKLLTNRMGWARQTGRKAEALSCLP